ncbi:MAG TPA: hypothetical protein VKA60_10855 [Blastocatellia bacterium]|nr:hypothetical protein [Blastocatellia bacterium]
MRSVIRQITGMLAVVISLAACADVARADVKVKSKSTQGSNTSEQTTYIKGQRQRLEMGDGVMVSITQCDLRRSLQLIPQSKTYIVTPFNQTTDTSERTTNQPQAKQNAPVKGGVVKTTVVTKDTGERKQMFGYTARHIITQISTESSPDACQQVKTKMETDAWYIDVAFGLDCDLNNRYQNYNRADQRGCQDRYEVKQVGAAVKGYPVWTKTTLIDENGQPSFTTVSEVIEFTQTPLDAALFEVPAGYREVKDYSQAVTGMATDNAATTDSSSMNASVKNMAAKPASPSPEVGAKQAGVVRLGLTAVKTTSVGEGMNGAELAAAIRNSFAEYLKSPGVEVVLIEAKLPSQIAAEAQQKACDFIINATVEHKKGGSRFGAFAPALSHVASLGGYGGSTAGAVAGQVASTVIITAANVSANVKAKDQLTLDLRVQAPASAAAVVEKQYKAKAQSNGEDIISPTVEQAAQAILDAAKK